MTGDAGQGTHGVQKDPLVIDWDGPNDPANSRNWSNAIQMANLLLVSAFSLYW